MKKPYFLLLSVICCGFIYAQEEMIKLAIDPLEKLESYSPTNIPVRVSIINQGDSAVSLPKPVLGRTLKIEVFDFWNNAIAISNSPMGDEAKEKRESDITLEANELWGIYRINIAQVTSPVIAPNQLICIVISYQPYEDEAAIEASLEMQIFPPNTRKLESYISEAKALALAEEKIKAVFLTLDFLRDAPPEISIQDGVYSVVYPRKKRMDSRGDNFILRVDIDASSGRIISLLGGQ